ncbi:unnamed protein product [Angiostrongylus costaricensis]|uniref:Mitochondrial carrier protein n=1 Tax=Angiostrongylus costaricensis TaxID=334426 RepID=A0A0R3PUS4_ANGCS|nr:unnamed protein product [Angiostrongylus costaricensis]
MTGETIGRRSLLQKYEHLIGGFAGGVASTAVCHPMDLLRIRYSGKSFVLSITETATSAVNQLVTANEGGVFRPQYKSYIDATKCIFRAEGVRGLYQGLTPNMVGAALSWGLYMEWYHKIKAMVPFHSSNESLNNFLCGFFAGAAVMCFTNPIWVTKTRLCLQYETSTAKKYSGMLECLHKISKEEGVKGLYKGFVPGLFGTTHGALQFMLYNRLKAWRCQTLGLPWDAPLNSQDYLVFSAISKSIATTVTFPYQVLRTRMQDHNVESGGVWRTTTMTLKREGIRGLYKGCLMANLRQLPAAIVTFVTYENVKHLIRSSNF